jgi:hypothetical protein
MENGYFIEIVFGDITQKHSVHLLLSDCRGEINSVPSEPPTQRTKHRGRKNLGGWGDHNKHPWSIKLIGE